MFDADVPIETIGMRHGEKLHETMATAEELARAEDMGEYFRIPMDGRDLNYSPYFTEGTLQAASIADYTSENAERLDERGLEELLLSLPEIRSELGVAGIRDESGHNRR